MKPLRLRVVSTFLFATAAFLLLAGVEIVNLNRQAWLGIEPGYAPHNFAFNLVFFIPGLVVSTLLALTAFALYLTLIRARRRHRQKLTWMEGLTILPAVPVLLFDSLLVASLWMMLTAV